MSRLSKLKASSKEWSDGKRATVIIIGILGLAMVVTFLTFSVLAIGGLPTLGLLVGISLAIIGYRWLERDERSQFATPSPSVSDERTFTCPNCGGRARMSPDRRRGNCAQCGVVPPPSIQDALTKLSSDAKAAVVDPTPIASISPSPHCEVETTKECPFCGEEIQAVAIKCKHCGEWLDNRRVQQPKPATRERFSTPLVQEPTRMSFFQIVAVLLSIIVIAAFVVEIIIPTVISDYQQQAADQRRQAAEQAQRDAAQQEQQQAAARAQQEIEEHEARQKSAIRRIDIICERYPDLAESVKKRDQPLEQERATLLIQQLVLTDNLELEDAKFLEHYIVYGE
jgi:uncharacterized membrane-anchored protein YhcB (DUF1043 family)